MAGDAGESARFMSVNILKVGHHGSKGASSEEFLSYVKPENALISCGAGNSYGHPHMETLQRLSGIGAKAVSYTHLRDNLLKAVWGQDYSGDGRTVDVHMRRLREKIEDNLSEPKYVHTKWGVGYYFNV